MTKTIRNVSIVIISLLCALSCLILSGCETEKAPSIQLTGTVTAVPVGGTLETALASCTLQIKNEKGEWVNVTDDDGTVATGYTAMKKAGAYISWSGSSAALKEKQTAGQKLTISITYNLETITVEYKIS